MTHILHHIYQYPTLKESEIQKIIDEHQYVKFRKGDYLLKEGQYSKEYYILINGLIRSYAIHSNGEEITTGFYGDNELIIEVASLFGQMPTQENLQCLIDCELYKINYDDFQKLFVTIPAFAEWGRMWMTQALMQQKERLLKMLTHSAQERYVELLENNPKLIQTAPLKYIASFLGITDTSLSRIRKELIK